MKMSRPDDNNEISEIEKFVTFNESDQIDIICDICLQMKKLSFKEYNNITSNDNSPELNCNDCSIKLKK